MKPLTRTRVDEFESYGNYCRVYGRKDHVLSTEVQITKKFDGVMRKFPVPNAPFDEYFPDETYRVAHLEPEFNTELQAPEAPNQMKIQLNDFPINRSIDKCDFHPLTSSNTIDVRPRDQLILMPYLTETPILENHKYRAPIEVQLAWTDSDGNVEVVPDIERRFTYHPTEQGNYFVEREYDTRCCEQSA